MDRTRPIVFLLLAAPLAVAAPASASAPAAPRPAPGGSRVFVDLARRLLEGKLRGGTEGHALLLSQMGGILADGLGEEDARRALASPARPATLPLAPELEELDGLVADPFTDSQVIDRLAELAARLAGVVAFLHAGNESYVPYRVLLAGSFAEARFRPGDDLEVVIDAGVGRGGERVRSTESDAAYGLVAEACARYAAAPGLAVHGYGDTARFLEEHVARPVDLGLGLELLSAPAQFLMARYQAVLKAHGILAMRSGRVIAGTPVAPGGDYVERHVAELARRFELMRRVLAEPLEKALSTGGDRSAAVAAAAAELDTSVARLGAYLAAWRNNFEILQTLSAKRPLAEAAARLGVPVERLEEPARLLQARLRPARLAGYGAATRSPMARLVASLSLRLEGYAARYRQALGIAPRGP